MKTIVVEPAGHGWAVRSQGFDNEQLFRSGAAAERAARRLAGALADAGETVEVVIRLRDGGLAGRIVHGPSASALTGA